MASSLLEEDWNNEKYPIVNDLINCGIEKNDAKFIESKKAELYAHILFLEFHSNNQNASKDEILENAVNNFFVDNGLKEKYSNLKKDRIYRKIGKKVKESVKKIIEDHRNVNLLIIQKRILEKYARIFNKYTSFFPFDNNEVYGIYKRDREIKEEMEKALWNNEVIKAMEILYTEICALKNDSHFDKYCEKIKESYKKYYAE